jgi:hypothetical protein
MEVNQLKDKIALIAKKAGSNTVYISSEDYHTLVREKEINLNGLIISSGILTVKVDSDLPEGTVRILDVTI